MMLLVALVLPWVVAAAIVPFDGRRHWPNALAALSLLAALSASSYLLLQTPETGPVTVTTGRWAPGIGITLRADALGLLFTVVTQVLLLLCLATEYFSGIENRTFSPLILFLTTGLTGLYLTGDAFNFYVFFEISMISSFVLTGYAERPQMIRAALTFTVVNLFGSVLFLGAVVGLYRLAGTLDLAQLAVALEEVPWKPRLIVAVLIFVSLSIKLGLFPFHFWVPSVYRGTHPAIAGILSGALASVGAFGLLRLGAGLFSVEIETYRPALLILGGLSLFYGGIIAFSRPVTGDVLAYSSISQAGYVLLCLTVGGTAGLASAMLFAIANSLHKASLFIAAGLKGPMVQAAFALGAMSLVGLPPTVGFFAKASLLRAAIANERVPEAMLLIGGVVLSYLYTVAVYQRYRTGAESSEGRNSLLTRWAAFALASLVVLLVIWPDPILRFAILGAESLKPDMP